MKFFSKNLSLWWHELANSLRLLRLRSSFLQIIKNFSLRQRLHFSLILLYGLHFLRIISPFDVKGFVCIFKCPNILG